MEGCCAGVLPRKLGNQTPEIGLIFRTSRDCPRIPNSAAVSQLPNIPGQVPERPGASLHLSQRSFQIDGMSPKARRSSHQVAASQCLKRPRLESTGGASPLLASRGYSSSC
jgi:hypothetical protein